MGEYFFFTESYNFKSCFRCIFKMYVDVNCGKTGLLSVRYSLLMECRMIMESLRTSSTIINLDGNLFVHMELLVPLRACTLPISWNLG